MRRVKLAVILNADTDNCPFGLPIPLACKSAGTTIESMAAISVLGDKPDKEEIKQLINANRALLSLQNPCQRCKFASNVIESKSSVECNYTSSAPGVGTTGLVGAPFYSKVYQNSTYDGLYSYPLGYYGDNNISRNLYYGLYSLQGGTENDITKTAEQANNDTYVSDPGDLKENQ